MKTLAVLAIAVGLISVQGSSINKEVHDNDYELDNDYRYLSVEGRDAIIGEEKENYPQELDDHATTGTASLDCQNNVCSICQGLYCLSVRYLVENDTLVVQVSKQFVPIFEKNIPALDWQECMQLEVDQEQTCIYIENVFVEDGHACMNLFIHSEFMNNYESPNICM